MDGLERYEETLEYLDKALESDPNDKFALIIKGITLRGLERYEEALKYLDKVLKIAPNDILALSNKGWALVAQEDYEDALKYLDKALESDPDYIFALNNKGYALNGLERYEEALEYLDKALRIDPNYAIAWYNKARLESLRNNLKESIKSLKNAIELDNSLWGKAIEEHEFDNIRIQEIIIEMVDFCPECSNLLRKRMMDGRYYLIYKCGYKKGLNNLNKKEISKIIKKKSEALKNNLIIVSNKEKILIYPKTSKICPKCGHKKAVYWQEQLFSADEPMVSFFRCLKCNIVWREY